MKICLRKYQREAQEGTVPFSSSKKIFSPLRSPFFAISLAVGLSGIVQGMDQDPNDNHTMPLPGHQIFSDSALIRQQNLDYAHAQYNDIQREYYKYKAGLIENLGRGIFGEIFVCLETITKLKKEIEFDQERFQLSDKQNEKLRLTLQSKKEKLEILQEGVRVSVLNPEIQSFIDSFDEAMKRYLRVIKVTKAELQQFETIHDIVEMDMNELKLIINRIRSYLPVPTENSELIKENIYNIMQFLSSKDYRSSACVSWNWNSAAEEFKGKYPSVFIDLLYNYVDGASLKNFAQVSLKWNQPAQKIISKLPKSGSLLIEKLKSRSFENQLRYLTYCSQYQENAMDVMTEAAMGYFDLADDDKLFKLVPDEEWGGPVCKIQILHEDMWNALSNDPNMDEKMTHSSTFNERAKIYHPYELCLATASLLGDKKAEYIYKKIYPLDIYHNDWEFVKKDNTTLLFQKLCFIDSKQNPLIICPGNSKEMSMNNMFMYFEELRRMATFEIGKLNRDPSERLECANKLLFSSNCTQPYVLGSLLNINKKLKEKEGIKYWQKSESNIILCSEHIEFLRENLIDFSSSCFQVHSAKFEAKDLYRNTIISINNLVERYYNDMFRVLIVQVSKERDAKQHSFLIDKANLSFRYLLANTPMAMTGEYAPIGLANTVHELYVTYQEGGRFLTSPLLKETFHSWFRELHKALENCPDTKKSASGKRLNFLNSFAQ